MEYGTWGPIDVASGDGWLWIIGLALLLTGMAIGYLLGQSAERKRWLQRTRDWDDDTPGSHRAGGTWER